MKPRSIIRGRRASLLWLASAGALVPLLVSCTAYTPFTSVRPVPDSGRQRAIEQQVHAEVNALRRARGLPELQRHPGLDRLARGHAQFMLANRGSFSLYGSNITHMGFEERALAARRLYGIDQLAENVIAGSRIAGDVGGGLVDGWSRSADHRHNLLARWQMTGIGVSVDADGHVAATQLFGTGGVSASPFAGPRAGF